ncbi:hypothetical protein OPT61_g9471 [Boeremia exigua]|uniref:Uncharacterized protein n=1 Tax=Boeremia exigua TaxID=749465 RepID=A0ACC2HUS9_9PLEO|nr:hypothetical protein OPT61_g9471 [Boeremia exigua]
MQLTNVLALVALAAVGVVAAPATTPPKNNNQVVSHSPENIRPGACDESSFVTFPQNKCSGTRYCCTTVNGQTTCNGSATQCNTISICCNNSGNNANGGTSTAVSELLCFLRLLALDKKTWA